MPQNPNCMTDGDATYCNKDKVHFYIRYGAKSLDDVNPALKERATCSPSRTRYMYIELNEDSVRVRLGEKRCG